MSESVTREMTIEEIIDEVPEKEVERALSSIQKITCPECEDVHYRYVGMGYAGQCFVECGCGEEVPY